MSTFSGTTRNDGNLNIQEIQRPRTVCIGGYRLPKIRSTLNMVDDAITIRPFSFRLEDSDRIENAKHNDQVVAEIFDWPETVIMLFWI